MALFNKKKKELPPAFVGNPRKTLKDDLEEEESDNDDMEENEEESDDDEEIEEIEEKTPQKVELPEKTEKTSPKPLKMGKNTISKGDGSVFDYIMQLSDQNQQLAKSIGENREVIMNLQEDIQNLRDLVYEDNGRFHRLRNRLNEIEAFQHRLRQI